VLESHKEFSITLYQLSAGSRALPTASRLQGHWPMCCCAHCACTNNPSSCSCRGYDQADRAHALCRPLGAQAWSSCITPRASCSNHGGIRPRCANRQRPRQCTKRLSRTCVPGWGQRFGSSMLGTKDIIKHIIEADRRPELLYPCGFLLFD
jgi:hypothetical protein